MADVLVTGGAGFIGSHVGDALLGRGHTVTVVDDLSGGYEDNVPKRAHFVRGSITYAAFVDTLFARTKFDYVFHLAAYAAEGLSHFIKRFNYTNNVIGSVNLINASVNTGVKGFVFESRSPPLSFTSLPTELGLFTDLAYCNFQRQELTGGIPSELGKLIKLTAL